MTSVWLTLRADLRRRWRPLLGLALLLGLVGGVVLTAAAGARRTETAYPRLLAWASAAQVDFIPEGTGLAPDGTARTGFYPALRRLPQIASMDVGQLYEMVAPASAAGAHASSGASAGLGTPLEAWSSPGGAMGITADRVKVLSGRLFDPAKPGQAMVDQRLAALEHLVPGSTLHVTGVPNGGNGLADLHKTMPMDFTVTAIVAFDNTIVPTGQYASEPGVLLSPSFSASIAAQELTYGDVAAVRLKPGASMSAFVAAAQRVAQQYKKRTGGQLNVVNLADQVAATNRAIRPQAVALAVFALLTGAIALAIIGQLLSRQLSMEAADFPVLRAIGATRPGLCALSLARLAAVTVTGTVIAVCVAIAASPLMPIGPARVAEPHPGVEVNLAILGTGAAAIMLLPLILLAPAAWLAAGRARGPLGVAEPAQARRPSRLGALLGRAGSVPGGVGVAMAFEPGHGRTAVPVRSAIAGTVIAVAALATAAVFGASLISLVGTPHAYGKNWDQMVDLGFGAVPAAIGGEIAGRIPSVAQYADGNYGQLIIGHVNVTAIGLDPVHGGGFVTLLAGRAPRNAGEIALGAQTMRQLHASIGQSLRVRVHIVTGGPQVVPDVTRALRIVGEAVLPNFSRGTFPPTDLGTGAITTAAAISEHNDPQTHCMGPQTCYSFFLLRYRPGADTAAAAQLIAAVLTALHCPIGNCAITDDQRPGEIAQYASIRDTPVALAAVLIVLATGTLAHVLLTSVRRRRRDLAMLKTLGLTRPQVLRLVAWQATALVAVSLAVGLPLGILAGRQAWTFFANAAGVAPRPDVPLPLILLAVPVTLLLANLIAAWPGWTAARVHPAVALRAE